MINYRKILATIAYNEKWTIRAFVANEALGNNEEYIEWFFKDLAQYGCICWMIKSLIRYTDTHKFFDDYYEEIQEILEELENEWFELKTKGNDLKNYLAWLSFEHVAWNIATNDLRLEI